SRKTVRRRARARRVALCRLLLEKPDMLLLDEPTNHLDAESVAWLERFLHDFEGTVVAITHDRYFLDNVAGWILELDRGEGIPWEGNYSSWLEQKDQRLAQEASAEAARRKRKRLPKRRAGRAVNPLRKSWSGCVRARKAVSRKVRRVWLALKN
ncbi:ABC transporter ATP-binding protein yjjK, partial [Salmonella enterica subsp. enterica serovar Inverness str. R8-3668]